MDLPKPVRQLATRREILDWMHHELEKFSATEVTRLPPFSITLGNGPEGCNWVWSGETAEARSKPPEHVEAIISRIVTRAQARFELTEHPTGL